MRTLVLGCLFFAATASAEAHRGWLTYAGLGVAGAGVVAMTLGAYDAALSASAQHAVAAYYAHGAAPTADEAPAVVWLRDRAEQKGATALLQLAGGGAAAFVGIALVLLDGWWPGPAVAFSVRPGGATVLVSASF